MVSSATIDAAAFLEYFSSGSPLGEVMVASLEGRMYPVEVAYLRDPAPDYVRMAADVVSNIHARVSTSIIISPNRIFSYPLPQNGPGDVLVFLTGREEIERCLEYLSEVVPRQVYEILALFNG